MKIAENIEMLEIASDGMALYPVLLWDDAELVLIDTGLLGQLALLKEAVANAGFSLGQITKVIITHHDLDHIGNAKILAELGAKILAHEIDAPYIQGDKPFIKVAEMEKRLPELNADQLVFYERIKKGAPYLYVHVDRLLKDGETLDFCGGIQVIHTPGHVPGHISLWLKQSKVIVAGDAANIVDGAIVGANPQHTQDMMEAQASFEKLLSLQANAIVCYHGGYMPSGTSC